MSVLVLWNFVNAKALYCAANIFWFSCFAAVWCVVVLINTLKYSFLCCSEQLMRHNFWKDIWERKSWRNINSNKILLICLDKCGRNQIMQENNQIEIWNRCWKMIHTKKWLVSNICKPFKKVIDDLLACGTVVYRPKLERPIKATIVFLNWQIVFKNFVMNFRATKALLGIPFSTIIDVWRKIEFYLCINYYCNTLFCNVIFYDWKCQKYCCSTEKTYIYLRRNIFSDLCIFHVNRVFNKHNERF